MSESEHARVAQALRLSRERFQSLASALSRMPGAASPGAVMAIVRSQARSLAGAAGVCLINPHGHQLHFAADDALGDLPTSGEAEPVCACLAAWVTEHGQTAVVADVDQDERVSAQARAAPQVRSLVMVPLADPASELAVGAYWSRPRRFEAEEVAILESIAHAAADTLVRLQDKERLRRSEQRLGAIFTHAQVGLSELSLEGRFLSVNDELCRILGRSRETLLELTVPEVTHPDDAAHSMKSVQEVIGTGRPASLDKHYMRPDGTLVWANSSISRLDDERGRPARILAVTVDLSRRERAEKALRASEVRYRTLADLSPDGILVTSATRCRYANAAAVRLLGADTEADLVGQSMLAFVDPEWRQAVDAQLRRLDGEPAAAALEQRWRRLDGAGIDLEVSAGSVEWEGRPAIQVLLRDVGERKRAETEIWRHANFDALTKLPNRRLFRDRLAQAVKKAQRSTQQLALLFIDLDGFKQVNDRLGHDAGDQLLVQTAQRLKQRVRETDTVARLGGDEFTVILGELEDVDRVELIAQQLLDAIGEPFILGHDSAYVSASLGITLYPGDGAGPEQLIHAADQAMYAAKQAGKNQFTYFTEELDQKAHRRVRLAHELHDALARGQLEVHYQPVVELAGQRIVKAEALVRWRHPRLGLVQPEAFIPLAEESGLIVGIGDWVFRQAVRCAKRWSERLQAPFQVSVNKSPAQFLPSARGGWLRALGQAGVSGDVIAVEITEGVLLDASPAVQEKLLAYRDAGIQVAIDDFGTGYSSLAYLKMFDIDYLKIDQSFVRDITEDRTNRTIAETIIVMAHKLGLKVIAEGIETREQLDLLARAGCDYGQGFLFSRPLPATGLDTLLAQQARPNRLH